MIQRLIPTLWKTVTLTRRTEWESEFVWVKGDCVCECWGGVPYRPRGNILGSRWSQPRKLCEQTSSSIFRRSQGSHLQVTNVDWVIGRCKVYRFVLFFYFYPVQKTEYDVLVTTILSGSDIFFCITYRCYRFSCFSCNRKDLLIMFKSNFFCYCRKEYKCVNSVHLQRFFF